MSISGLLNATFAQPDTVQNSFSDRRAALRQLGEDLQDGDLAAAKQDYVTLTSQSQSSQSAALNASVTAAKADPLVQALKSLGEALDKGDLDSAKQAYQDLQQQMHMHRGHGHHHGSTEAVPGSMEILQLTMVALQSAPTGNTVSTPSAPSTDVPTSATTETPNGDAAATGPASSDSAAGGPWAAPQTNQLSQAFQDLGRALQSQDLPGALKAFGEISQAMQSQLASSSSASSASGNSSSSPTGSIWMLRIDMVSVAYTLGSQSETLPSGTVSNSVA